MKSFIVKNTEMRVKAASSFEQDLLKLLINRNNETSEIEAGYATRNRPCSGSETCKSTHFLIFLNCEQKSDNREIILESNCQG